MNPTSNDHPLDNVIWAALTTVQRDWSRGNALARRFLPEFARFAGVPRVSEATLDALAADMAADEVVALSDAEAFDPGPCFDVVDRRNLVQMVGAVDGQVREPRRLR